MTAPSRVNTLTITEAAEAVGVSVSALKYWCKDPDLGVPFTRTPGGHRRFREMSSGPG